MIIGNLNTFFHIILKDDSVTRQYEAGSFLSPLLEISTIIFLFGEQDILQLDYKKQNLIKTHIPNYFRISSIIKLNQDLN